ncbi:MAG: hypothetical protein PVH68_05700 [Armatimonadota bacterium]|jgi:hypothetical protein
MAGLIPLLVGGAVLSQVTQDNVLRRPGVELNWTAGVDETDLEPIADVVAVANKALESTFPSLPKKQIRVHVLPKPTGWQNTVTDRQDTIYVQLGVSGFGELCRADAGPTGILCQAVAELHNPRRLAGFDRFVTHAYLVPAVVEALGPQPIPSNSATPLGADGLEMLDLMMHPAYTPLHPDFAAVAALHAIEQGLQLDGLRSLLAAIPAADDDPFGSLRDAATAADAALGPVFAEYDEANRLDTEEDGSYLIASFEPDETVSIPPSHPLAAIHDPLVLFPSGGLEVSQSADWAAHGTQSLRVHTDNPREWPSVGISDPDWKLKDWRRFWKFEMDLRLEADAPQALSVRIRDDIAHGHGEVYLFNALVQPGEDRHIAVVLNPATLRGRKNPQAAYFGQAVRASEVGGLFLVVHRATRPFTLYLDNLRVHVRQAG